MTCNEYRGSGQLRHEDPLGNSLLHPYGVKCVREVIPRGGPFLVDKDAQINPGTAVIFAEPGGGDLHVNAPMGVMKRRGMGYDDPMGGLTDDNGEEIEILLEKADARVQYRPGPDSQGWTCGGCRFYDCDDLSCSLVEGTIDPTAVCNLWTAPIQMMPMKEPRYQLFMETARAFAQAGADFTKPMWIPFLPTPGTYEHKVYGEIKITPQVNQAMVASVKQGVYQASIPLDAEHETKLSGAVAWIKDMRMNEDGSADALVEWTPRGQTLLQSGSFKYVSPEWFPSWRDPATGTIHKNVIAGGAITNHPFFKDKVLRALVASESGATIIGAQESHMEKEIDPVTAPIIKTEPVLDLAPAKATEPVVVEPVKAKEETTITASEFAAVNARLQAAESLVASEKAARESATSQLALLQSERRASRFTDIVLGKSGGSDGARWFGEPDKHVTLLETLATTFGEESPEVTGYIEQQTSVAKSIREGGLFSEVGKASGPGSSDPEIKLAEMAKGLVTAEKTYAQAYTEVLSTDKGRTLYAESLAIK